MTESFVDFLFKIIVVLAVVCVIACVYVVDKYEEPIEPTTENLSTQKTMELIDNYKIVTPLVAGSNVGIHSTIYVVHDNDRNVTCYLYDDGISCIPDRFLEEVEKWE